MLALPTTTTIKYLNRQQEQRFVESIETKMKGKAKAKYRLIILLMLDAGCRVTEAVSMKLYQLKPARKIVVIRTLKQRGKIEKLREVPMTARLLDALADYWAFVKSKDPEAYLFPSKVAKAGHTSRKLVWRVVKNLTGNVNPHMLRHTFCTKLAANGVDAFTIKELAGHEKTATTEIYIHATQNVREAAIALIDRQSLLQKWYRAWLPKPRIDIIPVTNGPIGFHIGRKLEIERLTELSQKKVNILLVGAQGMGKSQLLNSLAADAKIVGKVLRIDDMSAIKKTLAGMVLTLFNGDKEAIRELLYGTDTEVEKIVTKESIKQLTALLIRITQQHEYTILIDDATRITPMGITVLENLNQHFHMIIAARQIKIQQISFLTNFEKIELTGLDRAESIELITRGSQDFAANVEDWEAYKAHIWRATEGNPKYTLELIERFRREPFVSNSLINRITHTTAITEWDMSLPVVIGLSSLMILRYVSGEVGSDSGAFRLIGGVFLIFALFARNIFRIGKRRFV